MKYNFDKQWSTTSMTDKVLLLFYGMYKKVEVPSFSVFWWTVCTCLSIYKNQGSLSQCHAFLAQSFVGDGSWEIFSSLISYRVRHCRQVRQEAMSPYHTCGTWRITWWGLSATRNRLADKWGSSWTSRTAISDVPIRYMDSCAWCRATPHNTWCTARLVQRVVKRRCQSRFGLGYLLWVSCSVPWCFDTGTRTL